MINETKKPITPSARIPIAETFATISYSFLDGFLRTCHTLLDFKTKDFVDVNAFFMLEKSMWGF